MGTLAKTKQKLKGKTDIVKGKMQKQAGHGVKGGVTEAKGHLEDATADMMSPDDHDVIDDDQH